MDWNDVFWTFGYPLLPATVLIVLSAEYRAWRDRRNQRALLARLDRIAATLEERPDTGKAPRKKDAS